MSDDKPAAAADTPKQKLLRMVRELPDDALLELVKAGISGPANLIYPASAAAGGEEASATAASAAAGGEEVSAPDPANTGHVTTESDEALLALVTKRLGLTAASGRKE